MSTKNATTPQTPKTVTGTAAAAVSNVWPALTGSARELELISVSYSGAASGPVTLTVTDGATTVFAVDLNLAVGVPYTLVPALHGLRGTVGNAMTITVSAGAASSICKLSTSVAVTDAIFY